MAAICAVAGVIFEALVDFSTNDAVSPLRQAAAAFVAVAAVAFVMTVEQRRWRWALAFALGWAMVVALAGWFTASYNRVPEIFEFPFFSGVFAVLLAAPLFQTVRDEGAWRFPYPRLHGHAWTDAVIGAASLAFVGVTFLLAWLIAGLFDLIGIAVIKDLLREEWFGWTLAGFAFGSAVGLLREHDQLVATLQRLVMVVLGVLAPVLAAALTLFLLSLPFTGLGKLWDSSIPATPLMLVAGAGAILLANAIIGDGDDDPVASRLLRGAALVLVVAVLPLAIIAFISLGQRIDQYGWTPERMWGAVAVAVALVYGALGIWAVVTRRAGFDDRLRLVQTRLAIGLCAVAVLLALPVLDFGAISARSQMARLASGQTPADRFDWQAMAFDFGPAGRRRLAEIARSGPPPQRMFAAAALATKNRYEVEIEVAARRSEAGLDTLMRVVPAGATLSPALRSAIARTPYCRAERCVVVVTGADQVIVAGAVRTRESIQTMALARTPGGLWEARDVGPTLTPPGPAPAPFTPELGTAKVEVRSVERRMIVIDGRPVGPAFE
jgi:hypothetical protein